MTQFLRRRRMRGVGEKISSAKGKGGAQGAALHVSLTTKGMRLTMFMCASPPQDFAKRG